MYVPLCWSTAYVCQHCGSSPLPTSPVGCPKAEGLRVKSAGHGHTNTAPEAAAGHSGRGAEPRPLTARPLTTRRWGSAPALRPPCLLRPPAAGGGGGQTSPARSAPEHHRAPGTEDWGLGMEPYGYSRVGSRQLYNHSNQRSKFVYWSVNCAKA